MPPKKKEAKHMTKEEIQEEAQRLMAKKHAKTAAKYGDLVHHVGKNNAASAAAVASYSSKKGRKSRRNSTRRARKTRKSRR